MDDGDKLEAMLAKASVLETLLFYAYRLSPRTVRLSKAQASLLAEDDDGLPPTKFNGMQWSSLAEDFRVEIECYAKNIQLDLTRPQAADDRPMRRHLGYRPFKK